MALDKQKILNELGSVVNQLQSADCGCMGKLFSNSGPTPPPCCGSGCQDMRSCCGCRNNSACGHPIYNSPCAGEPCTGVRRCMGFCNPPKLYADTYNYLNNNLMQPVVQEVYDDLKSITPGNTIMNNPMGAKMGLSAPNPNQGNMPAQNAMLGGMPGNQNAMMPGMGHAPMPHTRFTNAGMNNPNLAQMNHPHHQQGMGQMEHDMGHMDPGMGQGMEQPGKEIAYTGHMGHMGQEMGHMGQPGQGMGQPGQGMGHPGHGMGHMGPGMGQPGQGMGHPGHGMGHMGPGMGQPGQGMGHPGHGMGHMDHGMGQPGQGMGHMEHLDQGMGQPGQGIGHMGQPGHGMSHMGQETGQMGQGMGNMRQGMAHSEGMMAGMGPQIVNMMGNARNNMSSRGGPPPNATGDMPPSPDMGQMPPNMQGDVNQGYNHTGHMQNNAGYMEMNNMAHGDPRMQANPQSGQPNAFPGAAENAQSNLMPGNMNRMNLPPQQMGNMNASPQQLNPNPYGQHSAGMAKFNQMFPGVMKGDLGFDPMAIAIQMNPANQQKSAMDAMQKMLMNNDNSAGMSRIMDTVGKPSSKMQPVINATNAAAASIAQHNQVPAQQNIPQQLMPGTVPMQNNQIPQVYTTLTEAPTMDQQQIPQQQITTQEQQQQPPDQTQRIETVPSGALPTVYEGYPNVRQHQQPTPERMYREPILPADTSRNLLHSHHFLRPQRFFEFNTLGQPIEMTPVRHPIEIPNQPQTLSPQPPTARYSNVKSTVSKTALMGNRTVGKTPSRSQLQQVYNQYKGSQSYTQQNIRQSARNGSFSEGHINVPQGNVHQTPLENIERHGGDTAANNQMRQMEQVGDVPAGKKGPDEYAMAPARNARLRNGLQDQVYTAYPTSAKWSFHGSTPAPFVPGYRIKNK